MSFGDEKGPKDMKSTVIESQIESKHQKILYVYDFLKMWIFYLELIEIIKEDTNYAYPHVTLNFGETPDENSKIIPDLTDGMTKEKSLEDDINDVFNEFNEDEFGSFDNIDDYDF